MPEKSCDPWEVSLAFLQNHRKIAIIGVQCSVCDHKHRWPIDDLITSTSPGPLSPTSGGGGSARSADPGT
jgi:hypothetical protein